MKKIIILFSVFTLLFACEKEDDKPNNTTPTNSGPSTGTSDFNNNYKFSDDGVLCEPLFGGPYVSNNGILSIISKPCSKSGSKFDGYFKWGSRPVPGTYQVVGSAGSFPIATNLAPNQFSIVFYGHGESTLYSTGGTVEVTRNTVDTTIMEMNWKDVNMAFAHDSSIIQFSGNLKGL